MLSQTGEGGGRGAFALTRHVIRTEGLIGIFAGNGANLLRIFPSKGVVFASSDYYRKFFRNLAGVSDGVQTPGSLSFVAGGCAGVTATALTYPLDFVRGRISGKGVSKGEKKKVRRRRGERRRRHETVRMATRNFQRHTNPYIHLIPPKVHWCSSNDSCYRQGGRIRGSLKGDQADAYWQFPLPWNSVWNRGIVGVYLPEGQGRRHECLQEGHVWGCGGGHCGLPDLSERHN